MGFVCQRQKNRLREAQIELETALALDRNNLGAVNQLGWTSLHLGEPEACIAYGEEGLRLSPRGPGVWSSYAQLGICHLFLNHVDLATDYLIKARAAAPQIWWVHFHLAGALGLKGDLDGGKAVLAESLKLKPEMNSIAQYLALKPWYSSPKELPLEDHTLLEGLRRLASPRHDRRLTAAHLTRRRASSIRPPYPEEPPQAASRRGGRLRMSNFLTAIKGFSWRTPV
jgi:adenylate cyclase